MTGDAGAAQPLAQQVASGSKADLHVASLEVTVSWTLRHNEAATSMCTGYKGGEIVVMAAAEQDGPGRELPHGWDSST